MKIQKEKVNIYLYKESCIMDTSGHFLWSVKMQLDLLMGFPFLTSQWMNCCVHYIVLAAIVEKFFSTRLATDLDFFMTWLCFQVMDKLVTSIKKRYSMSLQWLRYQERHRNGREREVRINHNFLSLISDWPEIWPEFLRGEKYFTNTNITFSYNVHVSYTWIRYNWTTFTTYS